MTATLLHRQERMPCLDGLRGVAALMVVFGHAGDFGLPDLIDGGASHCGVLIFFALSGFLMGHLYLSKLPTLERLQAYSAARIARIVPIYYLVVIVAFSIHMADPAFVYAVTPVQLIRLLTFNGSVSVFWSIGPEVQFYVLFAFLWMLHERLQRDSLFAVLVLALAGLSVVTIHRWPGVFVASKFHIFALGMLGALVRQRLAGRLPLLVVTAAHVVALVLLAMIMTPGWAQHYLGVTVFDRQADPGFSSFYGNMPRVALAAAFALVFSFTSPIGRMLLANRFGTMLGRISFSIYLLHVAIYDAVTATGLLSPLPLWLGTLIVVALTIAVSWAVNFLVEAPLDRRARAALLSLGAMACRRRLMRRTPAGA